MTEYLRVRASEILDQHELVSFLKLRFPHATRPIGRPGIKGTGCVETSVPAISPEFEEIRRFIDIRRNKGQHGFSDFSLGRYFRKYTQTELQNAEVLRLTTTSHFEPSGEECGTIYETLCSHCNLGSQISDLVLDPRRVPRKDISETIAWVEWVASSRFVDLINANKLTGAEFKPILDFTDPTRRLKDWQQLTVTASAGDLADTTRLGSDPFRPSQLDWRCPLGHSVVTQFLSEVYLQRSSWDGSDVTVTAALFGQGRNLLRPAPLIIISQRMYRLLHATGLTGFSVEVAHLI